MRLSRNSDQEKQLFFTVFFMSYFYSVNNCKIKIGSNFFLGLMVLKSEGFGLVLALFGIEVKVALVHY